MTKQIAVFTLLLFAAAPVWAVPKPAPVSNHDLVIYASGGVRVRGAANGDVIIYAQGAVRMRGTFGVGHTVTVVTKPKHSAA